MKAKRILASFIAMAMTMGMMSSLVLADESENAPEETSVVETTEPKEKETKKPEEKKPAETKAEEPAETKAADPEEKKPEDSTEAEPSQTGEAEPTESKKEEPSEPDETEPETTAVPEDGKREDSHAVPPKNDQVPATEITSVQITLDAPVIGAKPDYTATFPSNSNYYSESFSNEYYQNYIRWLDVNSNSFMYVDSGEFEGEHEYQVVLFLTARDGYCFTTSTTAKVNGDNAKISIDGEGHLRVAYNFSKLPKEITSVSITLDAPVDGAKPDYTAVLPSGVNYYMYIQNQDAFERNGISWTDASTDTMLKPDEDVFIGGHSYRVSFFLSAKEGYAFSKKQTTIINGQTANSTYFLGYLSVSYTFTVPGNAADIIPAVSVHLDVPEVGAKPDYTAELPSGVNYYSAENNSAVIRNDITWYDITSSNNLNTDVAVFMAGHQYRVYVNLKAKEGYHFSGNSTATINGLSAEIVNYDDKEIYFRYTFNALPGEVTDLITTAIVNIDAPVVGMKADYTATLPSGVAYNTITPVGAVDYRIRNGVRWYDKNTSDYLDPDSDVFEIGHQYVVEVYLTGNGFSTSATAVINGQPAELYNYSYAFCVKYAFPEIKSSNIGNTATVDGNDYTITNNQTNGTGTVTLTGVSVSRASVSIPAIVVIDGVAYKVNRIGTKAFYGDKIIKTVGIGSNVIIIDANAFYGCSNLTKVSGGKSLKTIGSSAFARCSKLKSFSIASTVLRKIGTYAFNKDSKLKTIYIKYTTKLTKSGVKKSLKGSKVKTVKVKKSKVKKYKKYFKKKNSGRSVKVKK